MSSLAGLLRFQGRLNRRGYCIGLGALLVLGIAILTTAAPYFSTTGGRGNDALWFAVAVATFVFVMAVLMAGRLHDRDKSGWWFLLFGPLPVVLFTASFHAYRLFPNTGTGQRDAEAMVLLLQINAIGLFLWGLLSLAFLPGTTGDNRYGPAS
ncbi:MAG: DUF805 domain-containing protein [Pseudomonadota bacterium]